MGTLGSKRHVAGNRLAGMVMAVVTAACIAGQWPVVVQADPQNDVPANPVSFLPPMPMPASPSVHLSPPQQKAAATASAPPANPPAAPRAPEGWTPFTHWTRDASGKVTAQIYAAPEFRPTGNGSWQRVDARPQPRTDANQPVSSENAFRPIRFGSSAARLVEYELDKGPVTLSVSGLSIGRPQIAGASVVYSNVAPDTDLRFTPSSRGVKEELVLRSSSAPTSFSFHLADPKGQLGAVHARADGSYRFDARLDGSVAIDLAPPVAYEQSGELLPAGQPGSAHLTVSKAGDGFGLTLSADSSWLKGRQFPVVLDPTTNFSDTSGATYGAGQTGTTGPCANGACSLATSNTQLDTGTFTDASYDMEPARSFFLYDLSSIPHGSTVNSATFEGYVSGCTGDPNNSSTYKCNQHNYVVELHPMTTAWSTYDTWNTLLGETGSTVMTSVSQPAFNATYNADGTCSGCFWMPFTLTSQVQGWVNDSTTNYGFEAQTQNDTASANYNTGGPGFNWTGIVTPTNPPQSTLHPYLAVTYTPVPGAPTNVTATGGDQSATVSWTAPAGNGGPAISSYTVLPYHPDGSSAGSPVTVCGTCTTATVTGLTNARSYYFGVYATNSVGNGATAYSNTVTLGPNVSKTVGSAQVARGDQVDYDVTLTNSGSSSETITGVSDTLPGTLSGIAGNVTIDGSSCTASTTPTCAFSGNSLSIGSFTLAAGASHKFQYSAVAVGTDRACNTVVNAASAVDANGTTRAVAPLLVCDEGLGYENWWTYVNRSAGPQSQASVNVANGNLVLQQTDGTPVQGHGRLGYVLRRTYNSESTAGVGGFANGWTLNLDEVGAAPGVTPSGLSIPWFGSVSLAYPIAATLIDEDGTRHVFQPKALATAVDVTGLQNAGTTSELATLIPRVLSLDTLNNRICVDQTYTSPAGVHGSLFRYIEVEDNPADTAHPCVAVSASPSVHVLGYVFIRPDRVRYEFSWNGAPLDMIDGAGNELRYQYSGALGSGGSIGNLSAVYESRGGCTPATTTCRALRFTYKTGETDVTDPANRLTKYSFDTSNNLTSVTNPDGSSVQYTYDGYGTANCTGGAGSGQLCSVTDPKGNATKFAYTSWSSNNPSTAFPGPPRLQTLTDRLGNQTQFQYFPNSTPGSDYVYANIGSERTRFVNIDGIGRVGEVDQGDTNNNYIRTTLDTWDAGSCRQPDNGTADNNLCHVVRKSLNAQTPDSDTTYVYNPEGQVLSQHQLASPANADTTYGYHAQYVEVGGTVNTFDDTVAGSDTVTSAGSSSSGRADSSTLYYLSDRTQSLTPRGNGAGSGFAPYETTYHVDDNSSANPNTQLASGSICSNPSSPSGNSGLLCESDGPAYDGTHATVTRYQYDVYGQRTVMTSPKGVAEGGTSYQYVYYQDSDLDLSGNVSAGGWLKAAVDPYGNFAAFAYDRAGNVTRSWERNATQGHGTGEAWGSQSAPPSSAYAETLHASGSNAYSAPWRYAVSQRDAMGNLTTYTLDGNGNQQTIRPPRGNLAGNGSYDVTQTFNAGDELLTNLQPVEATLSPTAPTTYTYDAFGNRVSRTDPNGTVTTYQFDTANENTQTTFTRGPWPSDTTTVPTSCRQSTSSDAPIAAGRVLCTTKASYDRVGNIVATQDANAQTTTYTYDALGRQVQKQVPRNDGTLTTLITGTSYDPDGHVTDVCPPRQYSEGGFTATSVCQQPAYYSEHRVYDVAGRLTTRQTYRTSGGAADTTTYAYDADGNQVSSVNPDGNASGVTAADYTTTDTYNLVDRKLSESLPRSHGVASTATWAYDPSGNTTAVQAPSSVAVGSGTDGGLVVDGTTASASSDGQAHPQSNPYLIGSTKQYTSVTLQNGGWIQVSSAWNGSSGGTLQFQASGTLSICNGCGITVAGQGPAGGAGGAAGAGVGEGGAGQTGTTFGSGGGGGGHAAAGQAGSTSGIGSGQTGGAAGAGYGHSDLSDVTSTGNGAPYSMGSGGGGGGGSATTAGTGGGRGGGYIRISASTIDDEGTITASGQNGTSQTGTGGGGGGGGGSGGVVWLTGSTVTIGSAGTVTAAGGSGGSGPGGNNGGAGAAGFVRIDADNVQGAGASLVSYYATNTARITAYSYDADNRIVDTVTGASTPVAATAGLASGTANSRTRRYYDADGHVVGRLEPRAFTNSVSTTTTDPLYQMFLVRTDYDADGRANAQYVPRYDNTDASGQYGDLGLSTTQTSQCPTGATPQSVNGVPGYLGGVGTCVTRIAAFDHDGNPTTLRMPTSNGSDNRYVTYTYTDDNLPLTVATPSPTTAGARVTQAINLYDADGKPVRVQDALGLTQTTSYFSDETVKTVTNPPGNSLTHTTSYTYDGNGNTTGTTDALGHKTSSVYYTDDLLDYTNDPLGDRTSYTYDATGNPTQVQSPSAYARDATNTSGTSTVDTYTSDNLLLTTVEPATPDGTQLRRTTFGYDQGGRKLSQHVQLINNASPPAVLSDGGTQSFTYASNDRLVQETGRETTNPSTITHTYDPAGNPVTTSESDSGGGGSTVSGTFYLDASPRTVDDGTGGVTKYTYDGAGARAALSQSGSSATTTATYTYSDAELASGMSSSLTSSAGSTSWGYDGDGRLSSETDPNGQTVSWSYNPDSTLGSKTLNGGGVAVASWSYVYDADYRVTQEQFSGKGAGSNTTPVQSTLCYGYDNASRLNGFTTAAPATACGTVPLNLTHDADGNRTSYTDASGAQTAFCYNADNSLASTQPGTSTPSCTTPPSNAFASQYWPFGGLKNDGCTSYTYDGFDRLGQAAHASPLPSNCSTSSNTGTYQYDGLDRQRTHNEGSGATTVHYDGSNSTTAVEDPPAGGEIAYALSPSDKHVQVQQGSTLQYLTQDGQGNVTTASTSAQAIACTVRFDPFGNPIGALAPTANPPNVCNTGTSPSDQFYRDTRRDATTGDYQLGSRTYDPTKAGFVTPDTYRSGQSPTNLSVGTDPLMMDRYNYVNGDPVNLMDPNGHGVECTLGPDCQAMQQAAAPTGTSGPNLAASLAAGRAAGYVGGSTAPWEAAGASHNAPPSKQASFAYHAFWQNSDFLGWADSPVAADRESQVQLICVHYQGENVPCGSVEPRSQSTGNLCLNVEMQGGTCVPVATVYGSAGEQITPTSGSVHAIADALAQYSIHHPIMRQWTEAQMEAGIALTTSLVGEGFLSVASKGVSWLWDVLRGADAAKAPAETGKVFVIGKQADTAAYIGKPGFSVLNLPKEEWSLAANDDWVQGGIDAGAPFMPASEPTAETVFHVSRDELSVFGRELRQLFNGGYDIQGAHAGEVLWPGQDWAAAGGQ